MAKKKQELTVEEKLAAALVREDEWPYEVPGNWVWVRLGSVTTIIGGGTPSSNVSEYYENGTIPWISPADLSNYSEVYISQGRKNITELGLNKSSARLLPPDTVMLSSRAPIGYVVIAENEIATNQGFKSFVPSNCYLPKYLYYYLKDSKELLESYASGTTFLELSGKNAALVEFPLPPMAEQQRIVDRIESLFDQLDQAKALIQEALDSFATRKAAILHQAFTGQLTKKWRAAHGLGMESWEEVPFNKFCLLKRGYDLPSKERTAGDYPLVSSSGIIDTHVDYKAKGPGIITGRSGTLGKVYYVEGNYWPLNTTLYSKEIFDNFPRYIYYYLGQFDFKKFSSSTAVPTLNRNNFSDIAVLKPAYEEQLEIVRILDDLFAKEQNAKDLIDLIDQIEAMKKTILGKAFRGELGTNEAGEESAVELLKDMLNR